MNRFVYAFTIEDKDDLLKRGAKLISCVKIGNKDAYLFENNPKRLMFNDIDKKKFLFSNKAFFSRG